MRPTVLLLLALPIIAQAQNSCEDPIDIGLGIHTTPYPVLGAPLMSNCIDDYGPQGNASWYRYTATVDTAIMVSGNIVGNPFTGSQRVNVLTGECDALTCVVGDAIAAETWFHVRANESYFIVWHGGISFSFSLAEYDAPDGAVNFSSVPSPMGSWSAYGVVDMNSDGLDDLVDPTSNYIRIGLQQSDGSFVVSAYPTPEPNNLPSWSLAIADWDGNGHRDMMYGGGSGATFMKASADGTSYTEVNYPQYIFCQRTNFVDLNNDGHLDAFSCHDVNDNVAFLNNGTGYLSFEQGGYGQTCGNYGSIFTDIDNDGDQDLFVAKCGCDPLDLLMLNDGVGNFTETVPPLGWEEEHQSWSAAWGDFDNDGDMDALIGNNDNDGLGNKLMRNDGGASFTDVSSGSGMEEFEGWSREWYTHDFNNDGWLDIHGGYAIHYNQGDMTFSHDTYVPSPGAVGDLNNDGYLDISCDCCNFINGGSGANWMRVVLTGVTSNRDGIGARVTIESALGQQVRDVRSGDGFQFMSFIGAHFGLGSDDSVDRLTIRWPSGVVDTLVAPDVNTTHHIVEGITTALRNDRSTSKVQVAPNPATDAVRLLGTEGTAAITVLDLSGRTIAAQTIAGQQFSVTDLPAGVYQVLVEDRQGSHRLHLVKQ